MAGSSDLVSSMAMNEVCAFRKVLSENTGNLIRQQYQFADEPVLWGTDQIKVESSWMRSSAWIDKNGEPRVSIDIDANRIILLDRVGTSQKPSKSRSEAKKTARLEAV